MITTLAKDIVNKQIKLTLDREEKENNIIIIFNGPQETSENSQDLTFFTSLCLKTLELNETPSVKISRIGSKSTDKTRPIKVAFSQIWDKRKFMSKLSRLQFNEQHKRLRVVHDMGFDDRRDNKKLLKEAYEKKNKAKSPKDFKYRLSLRSSMANEDCLNIFKKLMNLQSQKHHKERSISTSNHHRKKKSKSNSGKYINCAYFNACSLANKIDDINILLVSLSFHFCF